MITGQGATETNESQPSLTQSFDDRFELLGELGRGGFGIVYKARQRSTGQLCALKTLMLEKTSDESDAERLLRRLEREMALIARLDSPHVVRLYDSGFTPNGNPFLALELVRGVTLRTFLKRGPMAPEPALRIVRQVLEALANAHEHGIVHRDLKPENIMVTVRGNRVNAKVLDFGIASIAEQTLAAGATLTLDKEVLGTPCYMPPEQIRSSRDTLPASDVYALGLILSEMLTGKKAVTGSTVHVILARQLVTPVELPDNLQSHPISALINRASAKEETERYQNAGEMLSALESLDFKKVPAQDGALSFDDLLEIEEEEAARQEQSNEHSTGSLLSAFTDARTAAQTSAPSMEEVTAARRGRLLVSVALILVLGAVGTVIWLSRQAQNQPAAPSNKGDETASRVDSVPLSDDELGVDALLAKARKAKRDGRTDEAVALYQKAIAKAPDSPEALEAHEEVGFILLSLERFEEALSHFDLVVAGDTNSENGVLGYGLAQAGMGDEDGARETFSDFLSHFPDSKRADEVQARLDELSIPAVPEETDTAAEDDPEVELTAGEDTENGETENTHQDSQAEHKHHHRKKNRDNRDAKDDDTDDTEVKRIGIFD